MCDTWERWCGKLPVFCGHLIPCSIIPKEVVDTSTQLHGYCDASESTYARVIYLRVIDHNGSVHMSLIMAKPKVASIKHLNITKLELRGAVITAKLLSHAVKNPYYSHCLRLDYLR